MPYLCATSARRLSATGPGVGTVNSAVCSPISATKCASSLGPNLEGVNQATGSEYPAALRRLDHMLAAVERHRAFEYIPGLVLVDVDVTRHGIAGRHGLIEQCQPPFCLYRAGLTLQKSA